MEFGERMRGTPKGNVGSPRREPGQTKLCKPRDTNLSQLHEFLDFLFIQDTLLSIVFTDEILDWETEENPKFYFLKGDFWQFCLRIFHLCPQENLH